MKTDVFSAVLILITCVHEKCSGVQSSSSCMKTLIPNVVNPGCPTQSGLTTITNQILSNNVGSLVSNFQKCIPLGSSAIRPATSCQQIYLADTSSQNGQYFVLNSTGTAIKVTCTFDALFPNFMSFDPAITNGFAVLSPLSSTDPCPTSSVTFTRGGTPKVCYKNKNVAYCASVNISTFGLTYQTVCGKVAGYQIGGPTAFNRSPVPLTVDANYVDGISITCNSSGTATRRHVWTYAIGVSQKATVPTANLPSTCPCTGGQQPPTFVGSNYYCESGNTAVTIPAKAAPPANLFTDLLWDNLNCGSPDSASCCNNANQPWFCTRLSAPCTGNLEMRLCANADSDFGEVGLLSDEFYVQ